MHIAFRLALTATLLVPSACSSGTDTAAEARAHAPAAKVAATPAPAAPAATQIAEPVTSVHTLHNVFRLNERIFSGNGPEDPAAFDELAALGVKTIISVDGSMPMVDEATARGIRYVHVPVTYAQITPEQQLEIAKSIRDLPGPVYVHCHHGKHRGPAAVSSAAVLLGMLTPDQAVAFMKQAGTASSYAGLYACVAGARPVQASVLDALPFDFPAQAKPSGLTAAMVKVDIAFEHLGNARDAGWAAPTDHPDLVPAAEAGQLADNLRFGGQAEESRELGDGFGEKMAAAVKLATTLEQQLVADAPKAELDAAYKSLQASCKDCHVAYRDSVR